MCSKNLMKEKTKSVLKSTVDFGYAMVALGDGVLGKPLEDITK